MDFAAFDTLPDDIIIVIATKLRQLPCSTSSLQAFSLVDRRCYSIGRQILYKNIYLDTYNIEQFLKSFDSSKYGVAVRSLTICLEAFDYVKSSKKKKKRKNTTALQQRDTGESSRPKFAFCDDGLFDLIPLMKRLKKLVSFSLAVHPDSTITVRQETLGALVKAIPKSCVNLELDLTCSKSWRQQPRERVHVCSKIREVLPRMQNVRLRLTSMCAALFGKRKLHAARSGKPDTYEPVRLPAIKSLVVNCSFPDGNMLRNCMGTYYYENGLLRQQSGENSWSAVSSALSRVVSQQIDSLGDSTILLVGMARKLMSTMTGTCDTMHHVDMIAKECLAVPFFRVGNQISNPQLLRLGNNPDLIVWASEDLDKSLEAITENQLWKDVVGGGRLPAEVLDDEFHGRPCFATGCIEAPLNAMPEEDWQLSDDAEGLESLGPRAIAYRERAMGKKMVHPECRTGARYLFFSPLYEISSWDFL